MFIKLVRLTRDAELKTANGKALLSVSAVYDIGYGQNKKGQFLNLSMWGQQAEKLAQHLTKGKQLVVRVDDLHIEEYNGKSYLKGTLLSIEFFSVGEKQGSQQHSQNTKQGTSHYQSSSSDDDLPF